MRLAALLHYLDLVTLRPRHSLTLLAVALLVSHSLILFVGYGKTQARFTSGRGIAGNTFSTKSDWSPPTTSAATLLNSLGNVGVLRQGGTYQVCAAATDSGTPPSGISTLKANLAVSGSPISSGSTSVPLSGGSYSCGGTSYNFQSSTLTADNPLSAGNKTFTTTATDNAGNTAATSWTVTVDNTRPAATALQTVNKTGGKAGKLEVGDQIVFNYSEALHLPSVTAGWSGASTSIVVTINDNVAGAGGDDTITFDANLGTVDLGANNYTKNGNSVFGASMVWNGSTRTITVTLTGATLDNTSVGSSSIATYLSASVILDLASNSIDTTVTPTESGTRHF